MKASRIGFTIFPYLYIAAFIILLKSNAGDNAILLFFPGYIICCVILSCCYAIIAKSRCSSKQYPQYVHQNKIIKLWHIPCDLIVWGNILLRIIDTQIADANCSMGIGLSIMALLMIAPPYGLSRLIMLWNSTAICKGCLRQAVKERRISLSAANLHIFLHLLPITDIFSAIAVDKALYATQNIQTEE